MSVFPVAMLLHSLSTTLALLRIKTKMHIPRGDEGGELDPHGVCTFTITLQHIDTLLADFMGNWEG